jgi:hypothetical protein
VQPSANVASIDAIRTFRAALIRFAEEVAETLVLLDLEINRGKDHIEHDRMAYWPQQVRNAWDEIATARVALHQRRAVSVAGHRPACDEEKKDLANAQQRLQLAQDKVEVVRNWCRKLNQEIEEYQGRVGHFQRLTEFELPRAVAALDQMLGALDAYTAVGTARGDAARKKESIARADKQPEPTPQGESRSDQEGNLAPPDKRPPEASTDRRKDG